MADPEPPFYVGYLKLPKSLRGFLVAALLVLFLLDAGLALLAFAGQPPRRSGAWDIDETVYTGQFQARPYPMVRVVATGQQPTAAILLVGEGKHGAPDAVMDAMSAPNRPMPGDASAFDGAMVEVRGYAVRRGDLTVLQMANPPIRQDASRLEPLPAGADTPATLTGEIVDAKCYAGAMNPGEGKAHESCGSFCLYGGIPALFVTNGPDGSVRWYLMAAPDGGPVGDEARALVGRSVELTGMIRRGDGLATFSVAPDQLAAK